MKKYFTLRNASLSFLISISMAYYQYSEDKSQHDRLSTIGHVVEGTSTFKMNETGYVSFTFTTQKGEIVNYSQKCSRSTFEKQYRNPSFIYNPMDINEFEPMYDFLNYNKVYRNFFFLFLYPVFLTFFFILLYRNVSLLIKFVRSHKH